MPSRFTVRWTVPAGQARSIAEGIQRVMMETRYRPGCLGCSLSTEVAHQVTLRYQEDWDSEEDLRRQVRSEQFQALATLIEFATEPPVIEFSLPVGIRGLDYANEVRQGG